MIKKIIFIGAGNLATRLSMRLQLNGSEIIQVYSRTDKSASSLAYKLGCSFTTAPEKISPDADIYIISVSDSALKELLLLINFNNKIVVHTSGSIPMNVLKKCSLNYGVFYPLQTFSKHREVEFRSIPFCIEANSKENEKVLTELALTLSKDVRIINSDQRKQLHLAAVFASNFVNHMYVLANKITKKSDIPFDILIPLIEEVAAKINDITPIEAQTGPALRNDRNIIDKHMRMLKDDVELLEIYEIMTRNISSHYSK